MATTIEIVIISFPTRIIRVSNYKRFKLYRAEFHCNLTRSNKQETP